MKEDDGLKRIALFFSVMLMIAASGCNPPDTPGSASSADWAIYFVVWNNDLYEILDTTIEAEQIDSEIGEVKQYSDVEAIYGNGFSNRYPAGTKLYKITDTEPSEYIAIQTEGTYVKAKNNGRYGGK